MLAGLTPIDLAEHLAYLQQWDAERDAFRAAAIIASTVARCAGNDVAEADFLPRISKPKTQRQGNAEILHEARRIAAAFGCKPA